MPKEIKPNKDGYYRKELTTYDSAGNKKIIVVRDKDFEKFNKKIIITIHEIENGEITYNGNTRFKKWADEWLETYKKGSISEKNYKTYEANLKNHVYPTIGEIPLKDIKKSHCQKVVNLQAGKSESHVSKIRMTLYQIFDEAVENDYINKSPARNLSLPNCTKGSHRSVTPFERKHILKVAEWHHAGLWVLTQMYCGLRPSEVNNLNWNNIDFKEKLIHVKKSKTNAGIRDVPIPDDLLNLLKEEKAKAQTTFVFHQVINPLKPLTETSARCFWNNFKRNIDISMGATVYRNQITLSVVAKDLTPYCLRHTCATDYELAGIPLNVAKVLLGHEDVSTTGNVYTHFTDATMKDALAKINKKNKKDKNKSGA